MPIFAASKLVINQQKGNPYEKQTLLAQLSADLLHLIMHDQRNDFSFKSPKEFYNPG